MPTKRQREILDYISNYLNDNNYSPTIEEIASYFNLAIGTIHEHIENLKNAGYLSKLTNQPRSLEVGPGPNLIDVPLLGYIAAGDPILAIEDNQTITISRNDLPKNKKVFALKVKGDSMIEEGIFDGDTILAIKQSFANNGDMVIALIDGEKATLKKFYKEKNRIRLQPANPRMSPLFPSNIIIQGKVINIIRSFNKIKERSKKDKEFTEHTYKYVNKTKLKHRKSLGQYFTPKTIRETLINKLPKNIKKPKVLDPGCGTGEFLLTANKYFNKPELYGWDIDNKLVNISKKMVPKANIKKNDSLYNQDYNKFDFVIGNPPYYEFSPDNKIKNKYKEVINGRLNIFGLFIYQGLKWLKPGGYLAYVVPPSMNNGAYFLKLRKYIIENSNIEYLHILNNPKLFDNALQSTMLLILRKGKNKGDYIFKKNGILIFSENTKYLNKELKNKLTLKDLGYTVKTGRLVWNQNKNSLTNKKTKAIPLIWAHNITDNGLKFPIISNKKPQYVKINNFDLGPAIVVNRITGSVKQSKIKSAIIPAGMKFIAENHVNVIYPPSKQGKLNINDNLPKVKLTLKEIADQLASKKKIKIVRSITGNTQISKTELENLFPIDLDKY
ncbi:MAG: transcriptional repressor LexA [Patescibacteria group bacterium]|nr:transcriptional repressor LexA [Patescibacteria group bacterium]